MRNLSSNSWSSVANPTPSWPSRSRSSGGSDRGAGCPPVANSAARACRRSALGGSDGASRRPLSLGPRGIRYPPGPASPLAAGEGASAGAAGAAGVRADRSSTRVESCATISLSWRHLLFELGLARAARARRSPAGAAPTGRRAREAGAEASAPGPRRRANTPARRPPIRPASRSVSGGAYANHQERRPPANWMLTFDLPVGPDDSALLAPATGIGAGPGALARRRPPPRCGGPDRRELPRRPRSGSPWPSRLTRPAAPRLAAPGRGPASDPVGAIPGRRGPEIPRAAKGHGEVRREPARTGTSRWALKCGVSLARVIPLSTRSGSGR